MPKNTEPKTVTAKCPPGLLDAVDILIAEHARVGVRLKKSQALVVLAMRGAGLVEVPQARRKAG